MVSVYFWNLDLEEDQRWTAERSLFTKSEKES